MKLFHHTSLSILLLSAVSTLSAGPADVLKVDVQKSGEQTYSFRVTVRHADTGWDHYANKWDVLDESGELLGTRTLYHPHVDEQPFTRQLSNITISDEIRRVTLRAHDSVHGYGGAEISVELPRH